MLTHLGVTLVGIALGYWLGEKLAAERIAGLEHQLANTQEELKHADREIRHRKSCTNRDCFMCN